jgi:ribosome biogenesis GTPase
MEGLVMKSTGSWYQVLVDDYTYACRLRGRFKTKGLKVTNPIAVGDRVVLEVEDTQQNTGVITDILPRDNYIIRKSTRKAYHGHLLAANLDQAILVATLVFPRTSLGFIDRFLVSAESFRIPAVVLFNKADLLSEEHHRLQAELMELYTSLGYRCLAISALSEEVVPPVRKLIEGRVSLLSGHSGVGKSTLLNRIAPGAAQQRTAEVSNFANKGVHTTTYAEMFMVAPATFVIDTPGIKELGLMDIQDGELGHYFPEMRDLLGACRFHNCIHTHEPGCAVREAVESGAIADSRYYSYLSMLENEDSHR